MKAKESSLHKFLSQSDTQFIIPVYQRNYDWGIPQCQQLLNDIFEVSKNKKLNAHFLGSIVYIHDDIYSDNASEMTELTIIDGQQRLTTVTLIYFVLYRLAKEIKNEALANRINKKYLINELAQESEILKLRPTENNDKVLKYLFLNENQEEYPDFSRLIANFDYFRSRISEENYEILQAGLNKLMFV